MLQLHLGCGKKILPGYVNVDIFPAEGVDIVADARSLPFEDGSVDLIYACHLLEHFSRHKTGQALSEWARAIRPGGLLRLSVPNARAAIEYYYLHGNIQEVSGLLWGGQKNEHDYHVVGLDEARLTDLLMSAGFKNVRWWNWRDIYKTFPAGWDDYASAYLPHMQKDTGCLMSLNLEAERC